MGNTRNKTLIRYVLPTILSNCAFFLFTIVDGVFVGHGIGTDALGAVNIALPFVMIVGSLFMLTTIGGVTVTAIRLGRGDREGANQAFMHGLTGTLLFSLILSLVGMLFTDTIARLLGANGTFHTMVKDYLFWYSVFVVPSGLSTTLQSFARNDGSPILVSAATIISTCANIFGDWLCVFPLQMGLKGAAIATGVSQSIAMVIVLFHFLLKRGKLRIRPFRPSAALYRKLVLRGLPESIAQFATPVGIICMNYVLLDLIGDIAVNAYSVIGYVASFSFAFFVGAAMGLQPLFGQSYGAKDDRSLRYYFRAGILIALVSSVVITILLYFVGGAVCALFGVDEETLGFIITYMPQYSWGFILSALNTIISSYLYSTKRTQEAIIVNVLRSLVFNILITLLLPRLFGPVIVWCTFGIYEGLVLIVGTLLLRRSEHNGIVHR